MLKDDSLFLDTETTGLDGQAEICELSLLDVKGRVLMDTLIHPLQPIPQEATDIHGITDKMVAKSLTFMEVLPELQKILLKRKLIIYNRQFGIL